MSDHLTATPPRPIRRPIGQTVARGPAGTGVARTATPEPPPRRLRLRASHKRVLAVLTDEPRDTFHIAADAEMDHAAAHHNLMELVGRGLVERLSGLPVTWVKER